MSFQFVRKETFKANVPVSLPSDDPAKPIEGSFTAKYKYFDRPAFEALVDERLNDSDFLDRVLIGVEDILDENRQQLPPENQLQLVRTDVALGAAAVRKFFDSLSGAPEKNAKPSRGR